MDNIFLQNTPLPSLLVNHSISLTEQVFVAIAHLILRGLSHCTATHMVTFYFSTSSLDDSLLSSTFCVHVLFCMRTGFLAMCLESEFFHE